MGVLFVLSGCAATSETRQRPRPLGADIDSFRPASGDASLGHQVQTGDAAGGINAGPDTPDSGPLTLQQSLALALLNSPTLRAHAWAVRASEAATLQAGLLPNPQLTGDLENFGGNKTLSGAGSAEVTISLGQLVEFGGDRRKRSRVAGLERDLAEWDYESSRLDVLTAATQRFAAVLSQQIRVSLADSVLAQATDFHRSVAARVEAGKVSAIEERRAVVLRESATMDRDRAIRQLTIARARLAATWGSSAPEFTEVVGDLETTPPVPSFEALQLFISRNPEVARWEDEMALRRASVSYARAVATPDPVVVVGVRRLGDLNATAVAAGVSIPLPLFDRNQGRIREARYQLKQAEEERRAATVFQNTILTESYQILVSARSEITSLRQQVLPAARENFSATQEGYAEGKFDLLTVLDAQRTLFDVTNQYIDALQAYHVARAEVERLIGTPLTDIYQRM